MTMPPPSVKAARGRSRMVYSGGMERRTATSVDAWCYDSVRARMSRSWDVIASATAIHLLRMEWMFHVATRRPTLGAVGDEDEAKRRGDGGSGECRCKCESTGISCEMVDPGRHRAHCSVNGLQRSTAKSALRAERCIRYVGRANDQSRSLE